MRLGGGPAGKAAARQPIGRDPAEETIDFDYKRDLIWIASGHRRHRKDGDGVDDHIPSPTPSPMRKPALRVPTSQSQLQTQSSSNLSRPKSRCACGVTSTHSQIAGVGRKRALTACKHPVWNRQGLLLQVPGQEMCNFAEPGAFDVASMMSTKSPHLSLKPRGLLISEQTRQRRQGSFPPEVEESPSGAPAEDNEGDSTASYAATSDTEAPSYVEDLARWHDSTWADLAIPPRPVTADSSALRRRPRSRPPRGIRSTGDENNELPRFPTGGGSGHSGSHVRRGGGTTVGAAGAARPQTAPSRLTNKTALRKVRQAHRARRWGDPFQLSSLTSPASGAKPLLAAVSRCPASRLGSRPPSSPSLKRGHFGSLSAHNDVKCRPHSASSSMSYGARSSARSSASEVTMPPKKGLGPSQLARAKRLQNQLQRKLHLQRVVSDIYQPRSQLHDWVRHHRRAGFVARRRAELPAEQDRWDMTAS